ncbi:MAG: hypothetical protein GWN47_08680 [Woeseiaceae bacterium]|nr:hypothetical protein [Woeseiaceae bacterium]
MASIVYGCSYKQMGDQQTRYHAIDNLRATMISIVMFGHALLPYVTFPRACS